MYWTMFTPYLKMLEGLFQVRTMHVSLGKELMTCLMQYYTRYFILMQKEMQGVEFYMVPI